MKDLPSWLQAFAALVALGVSTWAILATKAASSAALAEARKDAKARDDLRARMIAASIVTELEVLEGRIEQASAVFDRERSLDDILRHSLSDTMENARIGLPPMVERSLDRLHWLGDPAGETMLLLISLIFQVDGLIGRMAADFRHQGTDNMGGWMELFEQSIANLRTALEKAKIEVGALHFGPEGYPADMVLSDPKAA
jgi:hypothetical protein